MPIRPYLADKAAFGPDTIAAMSKAFEEACIAPRVFAGDEKGREIVATRIIDLARNGLVDPNCATELYPRPDVVCSPLRPSSDHGGGKRR